MSRPALTRILVVEDNPTARKLYRVILLADGYDVVEASDGKTALESMAREPPALVLQDLVLPDIDGLELLKRLRALPRGRELPIVALSGFRTILEKAKALPLGFDATLVKPIDRSSLLTTVRALLPANVRPIEPQAIGGGRRVLLVDDDPVQLRLVRLRLLELGFEVTSTDDAKGALALARASPPDVVLSDVLMVGMDGFELCFAMRREAVLAHTPLVLMSAHFVGEHDRVLAARVGATRFARRTAHLREVVAAVCDALAPDATPASARQREPEFPHADHHARLVYRLKHLASVNETLLRRCAQQAAQLSIVGGVADALARSEDVDEALGDVLAACLDACGISRGALFRENAEGFMHPDQCVGFNKEQRAMLVTALRRSSLTELAAEGTQPVNISAFLPRAEHEALVAGVSVKSAILLPILVDGHCRAALFLAAGESELRQDELVTFGRAIGSYVAQAIALSSAFGRLSAAAEADRILFSTLASNATLQSLADLIIKRMADVCEIDLVDGAELRQTVLKHSDPKKLELFREMQVRYPPRPDGSPRHAVLSTKEPYLVTEITDAMRKESARDEEHLRILREIGLKSVMVVPLVYMGRALGTLTIGTSRPGRRHGKADLALAEELAARASVAIHNARLYEAMQEASTAKDAFLATVSHELRTPLNAILGWTRLLMSGSIREDQRARALESVERNAIAQTKLIEDLLDISRIVSGKLSFDVQDVDLAAVVESALDSVRPSMDAKAIRFEAKLESDVVASGDAERLQQVVWNLMSNAIKFTPEGGTIALTLERTDSQIRLSVKDFGQGIAPEFLSRVFERFQQADGSYTRLHGGLGLGLAISRHIVELHGGSIEARSEGEGSGALFCVTLPRPADKSTPPPAPPRAQTGATLALASQPELTGLTVLVVDDDSDAREILAMLLQGAGANVVTASSARGAMSRFVEVRPDVIVSDIGMPHEDGLSLIRKVRELRAADGAATPAIAVTGFARLEERKAALAAGYQVHLPKPFKSRELITAVATLSRAARTPV